MPSRQTLWARKARALLVAQLGGKCVDCGSKEALQFDHIAPRTWTANRTSRHYRMCLYRREAAAGVIVLRCASCNKKKGAPGQRLAPTADDANPF
jgi:5-methylcytosine-specific restriction endonuclease McrA